MTLKTSLEKIELLLDQVHTQVTELINILTAEFDELDEDVQTSAVGEANTDKRDELQTIADAIENTMSDIGGLIIAEGEDKP